jgi:hypothetical protein
MFKPTFLICATLLGLGLHAEQQGAGGTTAEQSPYLTTLSDDQVQAEELCGQYSTDDKKYGNCVDWQSASSAADANPMVFEKCALQKQSEIRLKRLSDSDACGGFDAYSKDRVAFKTCAQTGAKKSEASQDILKGKAAKEIFLAMGLQGTTKKTKNEEVRKITNFICAGEKTNLGAGSKIKCAGQVGTNKHTMRDPKNLGLALGAYVDEYLQCGNENCTSEKVNLSCSSKGGQYTCKLDYPAN